eukprot:scaffold1959_cov164-Isochrysis_galbana.AAC.2
MASRKKHRQWVMRERAAADAMLSTATSSTMAACELDDKCGSHWCHCPAPGGKGVHVAAQSGGAIPVCKPKFEYTTPHIPPALHNIEDATVSETVFVSIEPVVQVFPKLAIHQGTKGDPLALLGPPLIPDRGRKVA